MHQPKFKRESPTQDTLRAAIVRVPVIGPDVSGHYSRPNVFDFHVRGPKGPGTP